MQTSNKLFKSTFIYLLGNVLSKLIVFFLLPLYTKYIPDYDMGYYDASTAVATFFASVLFLDVGSGIMRFMMEKKESQEKNNAIYSGMAIFLISLLLYIIISVIVGFSFWYELRYFIWIVLYGFFLCLHNLYGYVARGWGYNNLYALAGVVNTTIQVAANLLFIIVFKWDFKSLYIAYCLGSFVNLIILESKCKIIFNFSQKYFNRDLFKKLLRFSLPLCVNSIAYWLLTSANKLIVTWILGEAQNGYLAIANKFTSILYLVSTCFQLAWQELAYSQENDINSKSTGEFYSKAYDLYTRVLLIGVLLVIPFIKIVFPIFVDSSYNSSAPLIPLALMGTIMSILSSFLGSVFGGLKKTNIIFITTLAGALINLVLIFSLIKKMGLDAANIAFLAGFTVNALLRVLFLKKLINLEINYWYYVLFIPLFILVVVVYNYFNWIFNLLLLLCLGVVSIFIMKKEIIDIFNSIKKKLSH